tara:strand:+ start:629 stop:1675 length:1047 start_codon:yes stop_codon:yes gene_type:complete
MKKKNINVRKKTSNIFINYFQNKKILLAYEEFEKILKKELKNTSFAVAVSGGPDSLALAYLSKCYAIQNNSRMSIFIVDHKLRNESSKEAKHVQKILNKNGLKSKILTWHSKKNLKNLQANARENRFRLLIQACKSKKIKKLLIGHHNEDLYENFFIRLFRGSGLKGLVSFGEINNNFMGISILRPLINHKKKDLIYISKKIFKFYVSDPTNMDIKFQRSRVRKLIPELKKEGLDLKKLKLTINNLKSSDYAINYYVKKNIENNSKLLVGKNHYILNEEFFSKPSEIVLRSIFIVLNQISGRFHSPRGKNTILAIENIKSGKSKKLTIGGCVIEKIKKTIVIFKEKRV